VPPVAFLTLEDRTGFVIDDAIAIEELARRGVAVEEVPWTRPGVDWRAYSAIVVRTPWDYQHDLPAFLALLARIEALGVPLANPAALVRWNAHKSYLRDLSDRGVPIVPTRWGRGMTAPALRALPAGLGVSECVLKPVVGANADDTFRVTAALDDAAAADIAARFQSREWMAQPFVAAVVAEGEHSLFYFGGRLSHAVTKRPKAGDFRVQEEHGGLILALEPDEPMRAAGQRVMDALEPAPLQARVDLVRLSGGTLALMELEAIEPSLYFRMHPDAPAHFADALGAWLAAPRA